MKKYLALLLVAVLSLTAILGLAPIASAADAATPSQEIAYFNVSISTNVELLFAVPADGYDISKETVPVQLLVWEGASSSGLYNYADKNVVKLQAAGTLPINGKQYIIFTYNGLSAAEMSTVVYARVMSTDKTGLRNYGDVYDYSIAEFANGYLNKQQKPEREELVEAMMDYGYYAAIYYNKTSYTVDEVWNLKKVTVTAKLDGKTLFTQVTQLAKAGTEVTLAAPHVDGATFTSWEGETVTDGKITLSDDVSLVANYTKKQQLSWDFQADTIGAIKDNLNTSFTKPFNTSGEWNLGSTATNQRVPHEFVRYEVVEDPNDADNKCIRVTHTGAGEIKLGGGWTNTGIGDTVESVTLEFDITASPNGTLPACEVRIDRWGNAAGAANGGSLSIMKLRANGNITLADTATVLANASPTKATKITVVLNFAECSIDGYVDGVFVATKQNAITKTNATDYLAALDLNKSTRFRFSIYGGYLGENWKTKVIPKELIDNGAFTFTETEEYKTKDNNSQVFVESGDSYKYATAKPAEGTKMYTVEVDYGKFAEYLEQNDSFYLDNVKVTYGDAMGK